MAKILIVDDEPAMRVVLESMLGKAGHDVTASANSFDALEELGKQTFDLLITDASMPTGSGFDLVKTVRKDERLKKLPIMMVTGKREKKDVQHGIVVGVDDYVVKPLNQEILISKVTAVLAGLGPTVKKVPGETP